MRFADFRTINRSRTLVAPTDVAHEIFENSVELFQTTWAGDQIRLIGVRVDGLAGAGAPQQLTLDGRAADWQAAERAGDAIAARFGVGLIRPASLLGDDKPRSGGNSGTQALNPDG
jgi:DNA polymerase-4